jgi:hypothetical protein
MAGLTFLRVVNNTELARQERETTDRALQERQNQSVILGLAGYLRECWDVAQMAKRLARAASLLHEFLSIPMKLLGVESKSPIVVSPHRLQHVRRASPLIKFEPPPIRITIVSSDRR